VSRLLREEHEYCRPDVAAGAPTSWASTPAVSETASRAAAASRPESALVIAEWAVAAPLELWPISLAVAGTVVWC